MWIGLSKRESGFGWTDGSALAYINWAAGEPNNWEGEFEVKLSSSVNIIFRPD